MSDVSKKKDPEEKISDREKIWNAIGALEAQIEEIQKTIAILKSGMPQLSL